MCGVKQIEVCAFEIIERCNLTCGFCIRNATKKLTGILSPATFEDRVRKIASTGPLNMIALTGGEPFLHSKLPAIVHIARAYARRVSVTTNGTILNAGFLKELSKVSNLHFLISLDGPPELHDEIRGLRGAFSKLSIFCRELRTMGIPFLINTTIGPKNSPFIEKTVSIAKELGAGDVSLALIKPEGRGAASEPVEQRLLFEVSRSVLRGKKRFENHLFKVRFTDPLSHIFGTSEEPTSVCGARTGSLHVQTNGEVRICTSCSKGIGNISAADFCIERSTCDSADMSRLDSLSMNPGACNTCEYKEGCGGCRCRANNISGDFFGADPLCPKELGDKLLKGGRVVTEYDSTLVKLGGVLRGLSRESRQELTLEIIRKENSIESNLRLLDFILSKDCDEFQMVDFSSNGAFFFRPKEVVQRRKSGVTSPFLKVIHDEPNLCF